MSPADVTAKYIELRDYVAKRSAAHEEELAPYKAAMKTLENAGGQMLEAMAQPDGKASIATASGTMYRTKTLAVSMADYGTFLDFVFENNAREFLTKAVSKDAVTEYIETQKTVPPGLNVAYIYNIRFNKPKE